MKIAVCEDDAGDLEAICERIKYYCENNRFLLDIYAYDSGEALLDAFPKEKFDIIFMDILFSGISGIDTARKIRETDPYCVIIFITASETDYAMDAYSVDGLAYVKKSNLPEDINRALDRCWNKLTLSSRFITVPVSHRTDRRVPFVLIRYVEVYNKEVLFHLETETISTLRMTLDEAEQKLDETMFLRCHRSYIVNMNYIDKLQEGDILMKNGDIIRLSRKGFPKVLSAFNEFMTKKDFDYDLPSEVKR